MGCTITQNTEVCMFVGVSKCMCMHQRVHMLLISPPHIVPTLLHFFSPATLPPPLISLSVSLYVLFFFIFVYPLNARNNHLSF